MARPGVWLLLSLLALLGPGEAKRNPFRNVSPVAMKPEDFVKPPETRDELMIGRFTTKLLRPQQSESVSVIVTSKNIGHLVIDTLESVRTSLLYILHETTSLSADVIVVDDASVDNSREVITQYIEQRKQNGSKIRWQGLYLPLEVGAGAARNFGAREAKGDILFFISIGNFFHHEHVNICKGILESNPTHLFAKTGTKVDYPLHREWKNKHISDLALPTCVFRQLYSFVGGYPEGMWQDFREDMFYQEAIFTVLDRVDQDVMYEPERDTVYYRFPEEWRYPEFQSPMSSNPEMQQRPLGLPATFYPHYDLQRWMLIVKIEELKDRMYKIEIGQNPPSKFALWAPYGALLDAAGDRDIKQLNFKIAHQLVVDRTISVLRAKGKSADAATVKALSEKAKASHPPGSEAFATVVTSY